jgi:two-component system chemotaxis response regulator CheB
LLAGTAGKQAGEVLAAPADETTPPNDAPHPAVVLIAASAGGIRALSTILTALPRNFAAPIVLVQHRVPREKSMFSQVLQRMTPLRVEAALSGGTLRPGTIYVARPDLHLTINVDGKFQYVDGHRIRHLLSSANPLFESSAATLGARAIAVVLTGSGTDGTDGVQAIKARGGTVIAQDRATSEVFGMPRAAIDTGVVDYIVPLPEIASTLVRLVAERSEAVKAST